MAEIVFLAFGNGSVEGKRVLELGCGGAPFLIAAGAMGASSLVGIDVDPISIRIARENLLAVDASLDTDLSSIAVLEERDVDGFEGGGEFDTVFMNPPFGAQKKGADRPFLKAASGTRAEMYSIHNSKGISFVRGYLEKYGYSIAEEREYRFELPYRYAFHTEARSEITAVMLHSRPG